MAKGFDFNSNFFTAAIRCKIFSAQEVQKMEADQRREYGEMMYRAAVMREEIATMAAENERLKVATEALNIQAAGLRAHIEATNLHSDQLEQQLALSGVGVSQFAIDHHAHH